MAVLLSRSGDRYDGVVTILEVVSGKGPLPYAVAVDREYDLQNSKGTELQKSWRI